MKTSAKKLSGGSTAFARGNFSDEKFSPGQSVKVTLIETIQPPVERSKRQAVPKRKPKSDAFEAIQSAAAALHRVGVIDKKTMREFDDACLTTPIFTGKDVLRIRGKNHVSQEVLARYMGITKSTVVKWESSANKPSPMAQRLLKVIDDQGLDVLA